MHRGIDFEVVGLVTIIGEYGELHCGRCNMCRYGER